MSGLAVAYGEELPGGAQPDGIAAGLVQAVKRFPSGGFVHIDAEGRVCEVSYSETLAAARRVLSGLRSQGFTAGDPVVIYVSACADFAVASWSVLLGGGVVVPLLRKTGSRQHFETAGETLQQLRQRLGRSWLVTDEEGARHGGVRLSALLTAPPMEPATEMECDTNLGQTRFLVLTSGTTGEPRLVELSERAMLSRWWPTIPAGDSAVTFMSWSPFEHIMGLGVISPNVNRKVSLASERFAAAPLSWLDAIERFGVTHTTMTSSGLLMVERAAAGALERRWNLSCLRKVGVGAEAVSPDACLRFQNRLAPFGLSHDALIAGYGLTECGPVTGGGAPFALDDATKACVELDLPTHGHAVRIVGPNGGLLLEGEVGAVEVRGPTMASGYFGDAAATRAMFAPDGWLRTGDLGSLRGGRLTITGRGKEQISIYGRKYAPRTFEAVAELIDGVEAAYAVACGDRRPGRSDEGYFALFIVCRLEVETAPVAGRVRSELARQFGLAPLVAAVPLEAIPLTTSGKVWRRQLASRIDMGEFDGAIVAPRKAARDGGAADDIVRHRIIRIWEEILGTADFAFDEDFFETGGDSVAALQMVLAVEQEFDVRLPRTLLHRKTTVDGISSVLRDPRQAGHQDLHSDIEARQSALMRDWGRATVEPDGLVHGRNLAGTSGAWFFCVQERWELDALAEMMGDDHPVYAMRSGHLVMDYTPANTGYLAQRYVREILKANPTGPYWLGGICQGCIVAREIALQLMASGHEVAMLALLDFDVWRTFQSVPFAAPVVCVFGTRSRYNPLRTFRSPELGWRKIFPSGVRVATLTADHWDILRAPAFGQMAALFKKINDGMRPERVAGANPGVLPDAAYSAFISAPERLKMLTGQSRELEISVRNESSYGWPADAGIGVGNHWLRPHGEVAVWADGRSYFGKRVHPGDTCDLRLSVRAPAQPGVYLLELDVVEEGVTWFKDRNSLSAYVEVTVAESRLDRIWDTMRAMSGLLRAPVSRRFPSP